MTRAPLDVRSLSAFADASNITLGTIEVCAEEALTFESSIDFAVIQHNSSL